MTLYELAADKARAAGIDVGAADVAEIDRLLREEREMAEMRRYGIAPTTEHAAQHKDGIPGGASGTARKAPSAASSVAASRSSARAPFPSASPRFLNPRGRR